MRRFAILNASSVVVNVIVVHKEGGWVPPEDYNAVEILTKERVKVGWAYDSESESWRAPLGR